jgi:hypothetical protein
MRTAVHTVRIDRRQEEIERIRNGGRYVGRPSLTKAERLPHGFELLQYNFKDDRGITASVVLVVEPLSAKTTSAMRRLR